MPSTLKRMGCETFADCRNLKSVQLPEKLEYIGKGCFRESALESVALPSALKVVEKSTFYWCDNLKDVTFPDGLERIGYFAFCKTGLENV